MTSRASQQASKLCSRFPRHHQHGRGGNHNESGIHEDLLRGRGGSRGAHQFAGHQYGRACKSYSNATRVLLGCSACLSTASTLEYFFLPNKMETSNLLTRWFLAGFVLISWISFPVKTCKFRGCYLCVGLGWPWYANHFPRAGWNLGEHLLPIRFLLDRVVSVSDSRCEVWCFMAGVLAAEIHRMTQLQVLFASMTVNG